MTCSSLPRPPRPSSDYKITVNIYTNISNSTSPFPFLFLFPKRRRRRKEEESRSSSQGRSPLLPPLHNGKYEYNIFNKSLLRSEEKGRRGGRRNGGLNEAKGWREIVKRKGALQCPPVPQTPSNIQYTYSHIPMNSKEPQ